MAENNVIDSNKKLVVEAYEKIEHYEKLIDATVSQLNSDRKKSRKNTTIKDRQAIFSKACRDLVEYGKAINECLDNIAKLSRKIEDLERYERMRLERDHEDMTVDDYVDIVNKVGVLKQAL